MNDELIRTAFRYGVPSEQPSPDMWERVRHEIELRPQPGFAAWWRPSKHRLLGVAAALVLALGISLSASPVARAAIGHAWQAMQIVWRGAVDGKPTTVGWEAQVSDVIPEYQPMQNVAKAAAAVSFQPAVLPGGDGALDSAGILQQRTEQLIERKLVPVEHRIVTLRYMIRKERYHVTTSATFYQAADGRWTFAPDDNTLDTKFEGGQPPTGVTTPDLGGVQGLCYQAWGGAECDWLQGGKRIAVAGPTPEKVLNMARAIVKQNR